MEETTAKQIAETLEKILQELIQIRSFQEQWIYRRRRRLIVAALAALALGLLAFFFSRVRR